PFSNAAVEIALASYPGCTLTSPPGAATMYGVYWPAVMPNELVRHEAVLPDGTRITIDAPKQTTDTTPQRAKLRAFSETGAPSSGTLRAPLGTLVGARSGDKGGNANIGV